MRVIGYEYNEQGNTYHGIYRRTERPIFMRSSHPIIFPRELLRRTIYSIEVWGLGRLDSLPWKTIYDSTKIGEWGIRLDFETRGQALVACRQILQSKSRDPEYSMSYERAVCRAEEDSGRFKFLIATQNPFLYVSENVSQK
jgi:hypothetical protein